MNKFIRLVICVFCLTFFSVPACAGELTLEQFDSYSEEDSTLTDTFGVTNGMKKDYESTFELSRTISGFSAKDTGIAIFVYVPDEEGGGLSLADSYEIYVGSSEIFSQTLDLLSGENYILLFAENGEGTALRKIIINRKDDEIKQELEQNIALPGSSIISSDF